MTNGTSDVQLLMRRLNSSTPIPIESFIRDDYFFDCLKREGAEYVKKEVSTPVGRVDLITKDSIFEFKRIKKWKSALGQILVYSHYFPNKRMLLYLFGTALDDYKKTVQLHCHRLGVAVIFHDLDIDLLTGLAREALLELSLNQAKQNGEPNE